MKKANDKYRIVAEWGKGYSAEYSLRYYSERLVTSFFFFKKWKRFSNKYGFSTKEQAQREIEQIGPTGIVWESS